MTSLLPHIAAAALYAAFGILAALRLSDWFPGMPSGVAVALGAFLFLLGAMLHDAVVRSTRFARQKSDLEAVAKERDEAIAALEQSREESRALREQVAQLPNAKAKLAAVSREISLLTDLVAKVTPPDPGPTHGTAVARRMRPAELTYDRSGKPLDLADPGALGKEGLLAMVQQAVRHDRIDIALMPIVALPSRKPVAYEGLSRIRTPGGKVLLWPDYQTAAEAAGVTTVIDNLLLFRCTQLVREAMRRSRDVSYYATISLKTLQDQDFMHQFSEFVGDVPELSQRLVFEFGFDDLRAALDVATEPMKELGDLGFRFAVDGVHDLDRLDVEALERSRIRTLKVDCDRFLQELRDPEQPLDINAVVNELTTVAIDLIVDRVEREEQVLALLDLPVGLAQGALFGGPR